MPDRQHKPRFHELQHQCYRLLLIKQRKFSVTKITQQLAESMQNKWRDRFSPTTMTEVLAYRSAMVAMHITDKHNFTALGFSSDSSLIIIVATLFSQQASWWFSFSPMFPVGLHRISTPALANPESGHFSEIRPSLAPDIFLAGFAGFGACQCSCCTFS